MLLLFFSMALTNAQQKQHDQTENTMYQRIQAVKEAIDDIWRPDPKLLADYRKAHTCYVKFHLYRVKSCEDALARLGHDIGNVETAQAAEQ